MEVSTEKYGNTQIILTDYTEVFKSGFSLTTIHETQDCRGRGSEFLQLLTNTSTRFTDT